MKETEDGPLRIRALAAADAEDILRWKYPPPYECYNRPAGQDAEGVRYALDPQNRIFGICSAAGELLGFCSFGADARVPGGDYSAEAADIGLGLRPERTGRRLSRRVIPAVLEFARDKFHPRLFRVTIAAFNLRAQKAWSAAGFRRSAEFAAEADGRKFVIFIREADSGP